MPLELWFPLALYYEDSLDAATVRDSLAVVRSLDTSAVTEAAAWTGDVDAVDALHRDPRFDPVTEAVSRAAWSYLTRVGYRTDDLELHVQRAWPVVSRPGQAVAPHTHATAHLSVVVYLDAPEGSGALRLHNSAAPNELSASSTVLTPVAEPGPLNFGSASYEPVAGRLVVFSARQRHEVLANRSGRDRVSLSYDLVVSTRSHRPSGQHEFVMPPPTRWRRLPRPEARADEEWQQEWAAGTVDLTSLSHGAIQDGWVFAEDHPFWEPAEYPHASSRQWWLDHGHEYTDADADAWRPMDAGTPLWSVARDAADRLHDHLASRGAPSDDVHLLSPEWIVGNSATTCQPPTGEAHHLWVIVRVDHPEVEAPDATTSAGSLLVVRADQPAQLGSGTFVRFGATIRGLAVLQPRPAEAGAIRHVPLLDPAQCTSLVQHARDRVTAVARDSVDGRPEYQVNLDATELSSLVGETTTRRLLDLGPRGREHRVSLFVRTFSPEMRTHLPMHRDVSAFTVNVPLDDGTTVEGGDLVVIDQGEPMTMRREQGVAICHTSELLHGVTRVAAGERWSLIALFDETSPTPLATKES